MIQDENLQAGVCRVNREIKGLTAGLGPDWRCEPADAPLSSRIGMVPLLSPAALEPIWSRGKLVLPQNPAESDRESVVVAASFKLMQAKISALAADAAIGQRTMSCLRSVAARIPGYAPAQDELFYLAHVKEFLEEYARAFGTEWTGLFAKHFAEAMLQFDHMLQQFPKWRAFAANAGEDRLSPAEAAGVPALADMMAAALRESDGQSLISPAISSSLDIFRAPLQRETKRSKAGETGKQLLVHDLFWSIENIAKRLAGAVLETTDSAGFDAQLGSAKDIEPAHPWVIRTLLNILREAPSFGLEAKFYWLFPLAGRLCLNEETCSDAVALEAAAANSCTVLAGRSVPG